MTNQESPSGVGFDRVASWDEPDTFELDEQQITEDDIRELAVYGFDSEKRTLVGLGPVERARRARKSAAVPDSERVPLSEQPGPFVADDDDELLLALRPRKLPTWSIALAAALMLLVAGALALRAVAPPESVASSAAGPVEALQPVSIPAAKIEHESPPAAEVAAAPAPVADVPHAAVSVVAAPVVAPPVPVKLPELPTPSVVDLSKVADPSAGTIDVTSNPPANVVLDGRPVGKAPRVVRVPAGVHTLVFIHPLYGRQSLTVNVIPGVTAHASASF